MIATMEGIVTEINPDHIVLLVNGIGFRIHTAPSFGKSLELHKSLGLYVHLIVREDSLTLYGFENSEKREMFIQLLAVSGVGPKSAMSLLSAVPIDRLKEAVVNENPDLLGGIPGVGKKTAQSIVIHLKGKIQGEYERGYGRISDIDQDVIGALTALGYSLVEAQTAVQAIPKDAPGDLESRVTFALRSFG
jgi:holliday junction DNA helicase RuvA